MVPQRGGANQVHATGTQTRCGVVTKYYVLSVVYTLGIVKATQKTGPSFFFQFIDGKK